MNRKTRRHVGRAKANSDESRYRRDDGIAMTDEFMWLGSAVTQWEVVASTTTRPTDREARVGRLQPPLFFRHDGGQGRPTAKVSFNRQPHAFAARASRTSRNRAGSCR